MLNIKRTQLFFSSLMLLISLVSFSGFTGVSTQTQKSQTELLTSNNYIWTSAKQNSYLYTTSSKVSFNQHTVFSFKFFLNRQLIDIVVTLKSQKKKNITIFKPSIFRAKSYCQINGSKYKNNFIK